jgi:pimeloyl-ACP methyl ester carboxylesterase
MNRSYSTGTVASGDVALFYRRFGSPGAAPVLILHGANYFDSADWQGIAQSLGGRREIVAYDQRGFGESTWSPSKNYTNDANIEDMLRLLGHLGWQRAVVMGHSRGGLYATLFAAHFPERTAGLVLVDYAPGAGPPPPAQSVNNPPKIFPTIEAVMAALSRDRNAPPGSAARARIASFTNAVEGGLILSKRDPDFMNIVPVGSTDWTSRYPSTHMWRMLTAVRAPILILRGTKSDRFPATALETIRHEYPYVSLMDIESAHDIASIAPEALIDAVDRFLKEKVDGGAPGWVHI